MARSTKLTPEVQAGICDAVDVGLRPDEAGPLVGVGASTVRLWLQIARGEHPSKKPTPDLLAFLAAVEASQARLKRNVVVHWRQQMPESYQACRDFMARRFPDEWGESTKVKAEMSGKLTVEVVYADEAGDRAGD